MSVDTITPGSLEMSSRNFQGIILGSKGMPSSKTAIKGWVVADLTVLFAILITRPPL